MANIDEVRKIYNLNIVNHVEKGKIFDAAILAVPHKIFLTLTMKDFLKENSVIYDVKGKLKKIESDGRL